MSDLPLVRCPQSLAEWQLCKPGDTICLLGFTVHITEENFKPFMNDMDWYVNWFEGDRLGAIGLFPIRIRVLQIHSQSEPSPMAILPAGLSKSWQSMRIRTRNNRESFERAAADF